MEPEFRVLCDKCLRAEIAEAPDKLPEGRCGKCGGTWIGPYAVGGRFQRRESFDMITSKDYLAAYARES